MKKTKQDIDLQTIDFRKYLKDRNIKLIDVAGKLGYDRQHFNGLLNKKDMKISLFIRLSVAVNRNPWGLLRVLCNDYNLSKKPHKFIKRK